MATEKLSAITAATAASGDEVYAIRAGARKRLDVIDIAALATPEGTVILSTGEAANTALLAVGDDSSAWGVVPGTISYIGQNSQADDYTLVLTDAGKIIEMTKGTATTLTIPANASVVFPVDTRIDVIQYGAGLLTVDITSDTLRGEVVSYGQYKAMSLWKRASTEWVVFGGTT